MENRILLKENTAAANELITYEKNKYQNGKNLLTMLAKIGYNADTINDWEVVESHFLQPFPKANLTFNLQSNGIETEYREAETFYNKYSGVMRFDPVTEIEIEAIKERHRIYASTPQQLKAHSLIHSIVDNFNELQKMGIAFAGTEIKKINRVFLYSYLDEDKFQIRPDALINVIQSIK